MKNFRLKSLFLVVVLSLFGLLPQIISAQPTEAQRELTKYIADKYTKREILVPMRDGVKLFTSIYEPKNKSEKYPIMLLRTPYTVAPYGETTKNVLGPSAAYAREGYIFVYQDVRGRWMVISYFRGTTLVNYEAQPFFPRRSLSSGKKFKRNDRLLQRQTWLL